ncbi:hypothetical protein [Streptomyces sulphureus]|uniref:hypothetical protein n=1 Tax=Streptomyces sulphureus TaxID=47758 RepID=UPI00036CF34D|nr:hypothetical protein [Streptomyces sulphureus]
MPATAQTAATDGDPAPAPRQRRLPWWALTLPAAAFALLTLLVGSGEARAAESAPAGSLVAQVLARVYEVLL